MSEVLQANIFFIITSIAVVVVTVFIGIALYHIIRILRTIREITERLRQGSEMLVQDAASLRTYVKDGIIGTIVRTLTGSPKRRRSRRTQKDDSEEN